ncbi:MAG TPA: hypothetical protein DDX91_05905 [Ruminococcaceae bacterium]|nr:hypothetical protein [Oscillospiraceae bacterium]
MKQVITKVLLSALFIAIFASVQVFAGNESLAHAVDLHSNEAIVYSRTCTGTYKYIWGHNSVHSDQGVWFVAETYVNGEWIEDEHARVHIQAGDAFDETSTYVYTSTHTWRLKVDPFWYHTGCTATGYIRNK